MGEFDNPLVLVSPNMKGKVVRDAQWLLSGHNAFSTSKNPISTYAGRLDGIYGPHVAGATLEAKNLLGYPNPDTSFGQLVYDFLQGKSLPGPMHELRAKRLAALNKPTKEKVLELAISFIGSAESNNYNGCQPFGLWYGMNCCAWCAIFVSYCISHAAKIDWKNSYVPTIVHLASIGQQYMTLTHNPEPGDLVTYTWTPSEPDAHIEIYEHDINGSTFSAVGGNTGNGHGKVSVARNTRYQNNVSHFIRLNLPGVK